MLMILLVRLLDKILGISTMNRLYQQNEMAGLSKEAFAVKLLGILDVDVTGAERLQSKIPSEGPIVIASNHPFGGIEGVILSLLVGQIRPDLKVLANQGLKLFPELSDYFIFTNPLSERDPQNGPSLRRCLKHVKSGGALLIFPAGRVSYYQKDKRRISEHNWNRITGKLISATKATYLPVFVNGRNSPMFYRLGRVYYRLRMLMLARELLNKKSQTIAIDCGEPVAANRFTHSLESEEHSTLCRAMSYAQDGHWRWQWPPDQYTELKPLAGEASGDVISREVSQLPDEQHLLEYKQYSVYFGFQHQMPVTVSEIARLRELVFREHNEGSGEPLDTDHFDATYTHLFVINRDSGKLIGAYRMGQTDKLLEQHGIDGLYLSRMFNFGQQFVNQQKPCLEMGRSFLIPEYQKSFQGLYLLWRGIGAFVTKFPQYHTLYGTVSLSKLYDPRSVSIIETALAVDKADVNPKTPFPFAIHPELKDFADSHDLKPHVGSLLASIEKDGKDVPILVKHYQKLGAKFHCLGLDSNFNDTPGLLLSVDLRNAPAKSLKLYLADGVSDFLQYTERNT